MPTKAKKPATKQSPVAATRTRVKRSQPAGKTGSVEANKALVRRLLEHALSEASRTNPETLHEYFADHFVDNVPIHHVVQGVHGVKEVMSELHEGTRTAWDLQP